MANTLEFMNVGGTQVGAIWQYGTVIPGVSSEQAAYLVLESGLTADSMSWENLNTNIGFDELKQVNLDPGVFVPGDSIVIVASDGINPNVVVAGPTAWPEIVPDGPVEYRYSEWSNVIELSAGLQNLPVTNLTGTTTATQWLLEWDKYTAFVAQHYQIQWKPVGSNVWADLALVAATEFARQTYAATFGELPGVIEFDSYNFRVRARRAL